MTITDTWLEETAKALNAESYSTPAYMAYGTTVVSSIQTTDTEIQGEIGDRDALTAVRDINRIEFSAIRSAAALANPTDGDDLKSIGMLTQITDGLLESAIAINGVLQTTNFDVETIFDIRVSRRT